MQLIEREHVLSTLQDGFKRVNADGGHSFFVLGDAGMGKTALVKTFINALGNEVDVFTGSCDSLSTPRPLAPVFDISLQMKHAWNIKPGSSKSRSEWFTEFLSLIVDRRKPVILVFEDIHWADEATADLIKFIARRITKTKCMFVLTSRNDAFNRSELLCDILSEIPHDTFSRIMVEPLSINAVKEMATAKGYDGDELFFLTGGNPFYLHEMLSGYHETIPANIKDSILSVFNRQEGLTKIVWQLLSIIPDSIEMEQLSLIDSGWEDSVERCINAHILVIDQNRIRFKHDLYRRTIEESLSPFKKSRLNKQILDHLLTSFIEKGEIEKIIHHAKNANDPHLVRQYAPSAAKKAASLGAHLQASKLYLTAIQYATELSEEEMVCLYESYAYECYLTSQLREAIIFQEKALDIWRIKQDEEQIGNSLRFISSLWSFDGNHAHAERYAKEAVALLEQKEGSKAKAMAWYHMGRLMIHKRAITQGLFWLRKALSLAIELNDVSIKTYLLIMTGCAEWQDEKPGNHGRDMIEEGLRLAMENDLHEQVATGQSILIQKLMEFYDYETAIAKLDESINYCEARDLDASRSFNCYLKAKIFFETGHWKQSLSIIDNLQQHSAQRAAVRIGTSIIKARICSRTAHPNAMQELIETKSVSFASGTYQFIISITIACLEYEWMYETKILSDQELQIAFNYCSEAEDGPLNEEFAYWLLLARNTHFAVKRPVSPFALSVKGKHRSAAREWAKRKRPFEEAVCFSMLDESENRSAISSFSRQGAVACVEKLRGTMRRAGYSNIPRGIRASTQDNPAQLTNREMEILSLLQNGAPNKEIAGALYISPKTVDHHITSVLSKLKVSSRGNAVTEAIRMGILK